MPTRKVGSGALAGAATVVLVWAMGELGVKVPPEVAAALTTLFTFAVSWLVPDAPGAK